MSNGSYTAEERESARAILRYLRKYPEAKDTVEGIAQRWLPWQASAPGLGPVERAVALLVSKGLLLETRRRGPNCRLVDLATASIIMKSIQATASDPVGPSP